MAVFEPRETLGLRVLAPGSGEEVVRWDMHLMDIDGEHMCVPTDDYTVPLVP